MRILIAGHLLFEGQDCAAIIEGGRTFIEASRAEQGCIAYNWSVDPLAPGTIHVFEEWESETDLGAHFRDPSYLAMRAHLERSRLTGFDVSIYSANGKEAVYDEEGQPRSMIFGVPIMASAAQ
ncbi:MAG TPA: antibiotic biosynthesis monooxygenase [Sphingobium sp.]